MRYVIFLFFIAGTVLFYSCKYKVSTNTGREALKQEIADSEKAFEKMAAEKSIEEAFWFFADSNAVIKRQNDTLIEGKDNIRQYYSAEFYKTATVTWTPDFVDVAESGDLGYTYGKYVWSTKDSSGQVQEFKGVFHTVWKKQEDGSWKYVWD